MIFRRSFILCLSALLILLLIINLYFIRLVVDSSKLNLQKFVPNINQPTDKKEVHIHFNNLSIRKKTTTECMQQKIFQIMKTLPSKYFKKNMQYINKLENIILQLKLTQNLNNDILNSLNNWPTSQELIPPSTPELGIIIEILRNLRITNVDNAKLGTQLKLMLTFENGLQALFKPQWYTRTAKLIGPVYYGKDRHNAEVVAFYLSLLLSFRKVPISLIKKLKMKEIEKNATPELLLTMFEKNNNSCFYGTCHYCSSADPVCGTEGILEGAIILWLPPNNKLMKFKHPWQRTYTRNRFALWEVNMDYCNKVKQSKIYSLQTSNRLLDLIDTSIFDFLIDNGDRHHYELLKGNFSNPAVLLIDNGKSLGNPDMDHIDILAPLYQCCILYKTTWERLQLFKGGSLSNALETLLTYESTRADVLPLLTKGHLNAINRRLMVVFAVVEFCFENNPFKVLV